MPRAAIMGMGPADVMLAPVRCAGTGGSRSCAPLTQNSGAKPRKKHAQRGKDQQVSHANNEKTTDKATADATSAFCADFLGDLDTSTDAVVEAGVWEKGSPSGSAMLVVKRGPNAGSRFRLD